MGWFPKQNSGGLVGGRSSALLLGGGTAAAPLTISAADKNFLGYWVRSSAASGAARGMYMRLYLTGAGEGEAGRFYATAAAANVATGGSIHGVHASLSLAIGGSVSGQGAALRATLDAADDTRTINGNLSAVLAESNFATKNTIPATVALISLKELGAKKCGKAFRFPDAASGGMVAAHTTQAMTHSVRVVTDDGTVLYLMATNDATNRTGGA